MKDDFLSAQAIKAKIREFLYDTQIDEAEHMAEIMGCTPISDDLYDRELQESERRIERIKSLVPLAYAYATTLSEAIVKHEMEHDEGKNVDSQSAKSTRKLILMTSFSAIVASLSQMVDLGVVEVRQPKLRKKKWRNLW